MAEMDAFERRLGSALERLADEAPTAVDAEAVVRSAVAGSAPHGTFELLPAAWSGRGVRVVRLALAAAVILALLGGLIAISQRVTPVPDDGVLLGRMTCAEGPWSFEARAGSSLDCVSELQDPRGSGDVRVELAPSTAVDGLLLRSGSVELVADRGMWSGSMSGTTAPNGVTALAAVLVGEEGFAGLVLDLRLVSADGLRWGLFGRLRDA